MGCPNLGDRAVFDRLVNQIFERRWFTNSGVVEREFEAQLCAYLGVAHCIPVCNATIGLQLACKALQLTGEVIVPAFTFVATPHSMRWEGLQPVFADVDRKTHTICPEHVESLITGKTAAIVGVHLWGNPCATRQLEQLGAKYRIPVFYDAAHAFGCSQHGTMIGNFGRCEVFSFHATKFFNTFEGGAIATNDEQLAHRIRLMKNFGFDGMDHVAHLGTNAKLPEISAAMGISMFARLDDLLRHNKANYDQYQSRLGCIPGLSVLTYDPEEHSNWQYIVVEIDQTEFGVSRDQALQQLHRHNVRARRYFYPGCHRAEPYKSAPGHGSAELINTDILCNDVLCLPTGDAVSTADVNTICDILIASRIPAFSRKHRRSILSAKGQWQHG